jgi:hypothetical protein
MTLEEALLGVPPIDVELPRVQLLVYSPLLLLLPHCRALLLFPKDYCKRLLHVRIASANAAREDE